MIPKDPVMLLSYINTQLRDFYDSYEDLCKSLDLDQNEVKQKLSMIGYEYDESLNQYMVDKTGKVIYTVKRTK